MLNLMSKQGIPGICQNLSTYAYCTHFLDEMFALNRGKANHFQEETKVEVADINYDVL